MKLAVFLISGVVALSALAARAAEKGSPIWPRNRQLLRSAPAHEANSHAVLGNYQRSSHLR